MNYGGVEDIELASKNSKKDNKKFKDSISTFNLPNPDILIRSGGFHRISNFMLYQIAFTEIFFYKKLWPDINIQDVKKSIDIFRNIERKFGK